MRRLYTSSSSSLLLSLLLFLSLAVPTTYAAPWQPTLLSPTASLTLPFTPGAARGVSASCKSNDAGYFITRNNLLVRLPFSPTNALSESSVASYNRVVLHAAKKVFFCFTFAGFLFIADSASHVIQLDVSTVSAESPLRVAKSVDVSANIAAGYMGGYVVDQEALQVFFTGKGAIVSFSLPSFTFSRSFPLTHEPWCVTSGIGAPEFHDQLIVGSVSADGTSRVSRVSKRDGKVDSSVILGANTTVFSLYADPFQETRVFAISSHLGAILDISKLELQVSGSMPYGKPHAFSELACFGMVGTIDKQTNAFFVMDTVDGWTMLQAPELRRQAVMGSTNVALGNATHSCVFDESNGFAYLAQAMLDGSEVVFKVKLADIDHGSPDRALPPWAVVSIVAMISSVACVLVFFVYKYHKRQRERRMLEAYDVVEVTDSPRTHAEVAHGYTPIQN